MLNKIKVELELISDPDMYIFFEKGMRGRVSYIPNRYIKANNECLKAGTLLVTFHIRTQAKCT